MEEERITSLQNPKVKHALKLSNRRSRDQEKLMVVEGRDEITLAIAGGMEPVRFFYCPDFHSDMDTELYQRILATGAEIIRVSPSVLGKISYREHPDPWYCIARQPPISLNNLIKPRENPLYLLAEGIEKPGNFGAMLRTADACGVHGVISISGKTDLFNPNVVRSSKGSLFTVPVASSENEEVYHWLLDQGVKIVAADPNGSQNYWQARYTGPTAIVVGTEDRGLSDFWKQKADFFVTIPMVGKVNSLNVALSGGLLLYEAVRQRTGE